MSLPFWTRVVVLDERPNRTHVILQQFGKG